MIPCTTPESTTYYAAYTVVNGCPTFVLKAVISAGVDKQQVPKTVHWYLFRHPSRMSATKHYLRVGIMIYRRIPTTEAFPGRHAGTLLAGSSDYSHP